MRAGFGYTTRHHEHRMAIGWLAGWDWVWSVGRLEMHITSEMWRMGKPLQWGKASNQVATEHSHNSQVQWKDVASKNRKQAKNNTRFFLSAFAIENSFCVVAVRNTLEAIITL